eukprot:4692306-Pyramimonas_sp.AAC.1
MARFFQCGVLGKSRPIRSGYIHPEPLLDAPGARRGPLEAEHRETPPSRFFNTLEVWGRS